MELKYESKHLSHSEAMEYSCFNAEAQIAQAKQLRADTIAGFFRKSLHQIKHVAEARKIAKHEKADLNRHDVSTLGKPCY